MKHEPTQEELLRQIAALEEERERYRALIDNSPDLIYRTDLQGRITYVSNSVLRLSGYTIEETIGMNMAEEVYLYPAERKTFLELLQQTGLVTNFQARLKRKDGSVWWASTNAQLLKDNDGNIIGVEGITRDISALKEAELALKDSEERYRTVFNESPDAITISELNTARYLDVNEGFCRLSGFRREEVIGKTLLDLNLIVHPGDRDRYVQELIDKGQVDNFEVSFRIKDGTIKDTVLSARKIRYAGLLCLAVVVRDLTPVREAERQKIELEKQLQHAQKMEAIGTLAGGVAHDFNNLLTAIMGNSELAIKARMEGRDTSGHLDQIVKSAERARDLVKQLLTFSRSSETELRRIDLNALVVDSLRMIERTIPKMIEIELDLANGPNIVLADAPQLELVIMNLVNNANDAMPDGGNLTFTTRPFLVDDDFGQLHPEIKPGPYVRLAVSDTGQGMEADTQKKIFDPFFTTKTVGKGTGLGLSTVYGVISEHQGHISCHSHPGEGTTFEIYLPAQDEAPADATDQTASEEALVGGAETILLVDDEETIRILGSELLGKVGYKVIAASSGEEALTQYARNGDSIDLVVLDLGMPGMGGMKCLHELLAMDPGAKVLIASGYSADGRIKDSLDKGASGYITKPYRIHDLLHTVRKTLDA